MRALSPAATAALSRSPLPLALLVELELTLPLYLNTASLDLTLGGTTYYGTRGLGKIEAIAESPAEIKPLRFELSGVPGESIALALAEPVQGKPVRIKLALFDPDTYALLDVSLRWAGRLDVMTITDGDGTATITVQAEHAGIDLVRPQTSLYSNAEQQRLHPGDPSFQYIAEQADMKIVWPSAAYGRV